jgi:XTP/dITP diphosphohydrolase
MAKLKTRPVVIATTNLGKVKEILSLLLDFPFVLSSLRDHFDPVPSIPENGDTFEENARIKADWVYSQLGQWTIADDSGLEVDFLKGAPGVHSARYAGLHATDAENNKKLLAALDGVPEGQRSARFRCTIAFKTDETILVAHGKCEGRIGLAPAGDTGFGYDPLFIPFGFHRTFSELDLHVKNAISHRCKALLNLRKEIRRFYGDRLFR